MYIKAPTAKGNCRYVREYPADCAKEIGKRSFVKTLGTRNIAEANKRQKEIDDLYDAEVFNIRSRSLIPKAERESLVDYLIQCDLLPANATDIDLQTTRKLIADIDALQKQGMESKPFAPKFGKISTVNLSTARERLLDSQKRFSQLTSIPDRVDVAKTLYRQKPRPGETAVEIIDKVMDAIERIYIPPQTPEGKPSTYKLRHVYEKWETHKKRTPRQIMHVGRAYRLLKEWCGDRPINSYTKQEMRDFLAALQRMPLALPPDIKAMASLRKQYDAVIARNIEGKTRAGQTVQNIKDAVSSLFEIAINELDVEMKNPIKGISVDTKRGKKHRLRYEEEDLQRIFYSPLYKGFKSDRSRHQPGSMMIKNARFWLPLIGLYTGARQEELGQLLISNVVDKKGVLYFQLYDWDETQSLKNENSLRTVPVHQELIRFGFRDYFEAMKRNGENKLFPDLKAGREGRNAKEFSKWYGRVCRHLGIQVQTEFTRKDFHSYRHTFITAARTAGISPEITIQIVGHGEGDFGNVSVIHRGYGIYEPHVLNDALQRIKYDGLNLSFLYTAPKPLRIKPRPVKKAAKLDAAKPAGNKVYKLKRPRPKS